jgi:hypothetical protein
VEPIEDSSRMGGMEQSIVRQWQTRHDIKAIIIIDSSASLASFISSNPLK